jgi:hypothetical protein
MPLTITKGTSLFKSKKELKEHVKSGGRVFLSDPSVFCPVGEGRLFEAREIPGSYTFVGPHQHDRKWYGQIKITEDGKVTIS